MKAIETKSEAGRTHPARCRLGRAYGRTLASDRHVSLIHEGPVMSTPVMNMHHPATAIGLMARFGVVILPSMAHTLRRPVGVVVSPGAFAACQAAGRPAESPRHEF